MIKLKSLLNEGKWKEVDYIEGDAGGTPVWEYDRSLFDRLMSLPFLKGKFSNLPKIHKIEGSYGRPDMFTSNDELNLVITFGKKAIHTRS